MDKIRWNILLIYIGLQLTLGGALYFALKLLAPGVVDGNEELIIGGVMAIVGAVFGYIGGFANGVLSALTAPSGGPAMMTEDTAIKMAELVSDSYAEASK